MIEKHAEVIGELFDRDFFFWPERTRLTVAATVKREQANAGRRAKQIKRLVRVRAQPVLEHEWNSTAVFTVVELNAVVFEMRHVSPEVSSEESAWPRRPWIHPDRASRSCRKNSCGPVYRDS